MLSVLQALVGISAFSALNVVSTEKFAVDGSLEFSIHEGITEGKVSFVTQNSSTIDAQFRITVEA